MKKVKKTKAKLKKSEITMGGGVPKEFQNNEIPKALVEKYKTKAKK